MPHQIVSRDEWLAAREALLAKEKVFTKERDALSQERRRLPCVKFDKTYVFVGPAGKETLADLFARRNQLLVYHLHVRARLERRLPGLLVLGGQLQRRRGAWEPTRRVAGGDFALAA